MRGPQTTSSPSSTALSKSVAFPKNRPGGPLEILIDGSSLMRFDPWQIADDALKRLPFDEICVSGVVAEAPCTVSCTL